MVQKRNYGIDFLRNILMLFIIIGHLFVHTGIRNEVPFLSNKMSDFMQRMINKEEY